MKKKTEKKNEIASDEILSLNSENEKKQERKIERELYWILGVMIGSIIIFLVSNSVFESLSSFEYMGLKFTKDKLGDIPLYKHTYSFTDPRGITGQVINEPRTFNLFLRNDPRKNNVSVDGEITIGTSHTLFISVNTTGLTECKYSSVGIASLTNFLAYNLVRVKGATPDPELANETGVEYATCDTHSENQVIIIQEGDETKIEKESSKCYIIKVNECEILPAVEKFMVQSIIDARARNIEISDNQVRF